MRRKPAGGNQAKRPACPAGLGTAPRHRGCEQQPPPPGSSHPRRGEAGALFGERSSNSGNKNPALAGLLRAWSPDKEERQEERKQPALRSAPRRRWGHRQSPAVSCQLQQPRDAGTARAGGWGAEKSRRLLLLQLSGIYLFIIFFCRPQPRGGGDAIGGQPELFGECWTPHRRSSRGGGWF